MTNLSLKDFSYEFPEKLIATKPTDKRDESRLMVLNRQNQTQSWHDKFSDITSYFERDDVLVLNNSRVIPARLLTKRPTGGKQEILLVKPTHEDIWEVLLSNNKKVKQGDTFTWPGLKIEIINDPKDSPRLARLAHEKDLNEILDEIGHMPLPPYMRRDDEEFDKKRYQTVYAKVSGSVAAPTAGLHFTPELLDELKAGGVIITHVTLHVGLGTFLPVKTENIHKHKMHTERYEISDETVQIIKEAKTNEKRVTALGTTTVRVLESVAKKYGKLQADKGETDIFIYPPYSFQVIDRLITNFHQSESTLLMLVSALAGREFILSSYQEAIKRKYRLFSYGDAMLIE
jgi:S-adenosylmethionine:tRNA ribosyltransferase-isomerase